MVQIAADPAALVALQSAELKIRRRLFSPPPTLTLSEWADRHRHLSSVSSAEPGRWRTSRAEYQREIMDTISDPQYEEIVVVMASQSGKSECGILNPIGYYMDQDPAPILVIQPSLEPMAKAFSKDRLAPMVNDSPALRGKIKRSNRRDADNTTLHKSFPGGHITIAGSNSPASLASRPIRILLCDETDRYAMSAGNEGDPIALATKRTTTFWNRKIVKVSSPTIEGASVIDEAFKAGDQRYYFVPCPACDEMQRLVWQERNADKSLKAGVSFEPIGYKCAKCQTVIPETAKAKMLERGEWRATFPGRRVASFHLSALYSPWVTWETLRDEFRVAQGTPEKLQVFLNTRLAETFKLSGEDAASGAVLSQRVRDEVPSDVADGVGLLTAGVDVQADRLEFLLVGWGAGQESWLLRREVIIGDPEQQVVWDDLDIWRRKRYALPSGAQLRIRAMCVDSGYATTAVYRYVRTRQRRGVWATKGISQRARALISKPQQPNKFGVRVVSVGPDTGKDTLFARLKQTNGGPGFIHVTQRITDEFMEQFGAETKQIRKVKGVPVAEYILKAGRRNEAIDLYVLNMAALHLLGPSVYENLSTFVERARKLKPPPTDEPPPSAPVETSPPAPPSPPIVRPRAPFMPPRRGGYVKGW